MFWKNFIELCNYKNVSPTTVVVILSISRGSVTAWKKGIIPNDTTLKKISDYFGVTPEYLLRNNETVSHSRADEIYEQYLTLSEEGKAKAKEYIDLLLLQQQKDEKK